MSGRRALAIVLTVACLAGAARARLGDAAELAASARPAGGWTFAHAPGERPRPHTQLVQVVERLAAPVGLATWDLVVVRSPGTPAGGLALLAARPTSPAIARAIRSAADLLVAIQLPSGGWFSEMPVYDTVRAWWFTPVDLHASLDDDVTPGAIRFLLAAWARLGDDRYREAAVRGLDLLLRSQHAAGGWPVVARPPWLERLRPAGRVRLALNDGATPLAIVTLLAGATALGRPDLEHAARRGGEWLRRVRIPGAGWAQHYDLAGRPAPGRRFEPAALATWETRHAVEALLALARATGDARYCEPALGAVRWLRRIALRAGCWARFHDLASGAPVFLRDDGRRVPDPARARASYSWTGEFGIPALLARLGPAAAPPRGAPAPGDPGTCDREGDGTGRFAGARLLIARAARARPIRPLDLGPCETGAAR